MYTALHGPLLPAAVRGSHRIEYTPTQRTILESGRCQYAGLVRVATPDPARLWTGVGDLPVNDSTFDPDGTLFLGGGRLIDLPTFQRLINGIAERIVYTLNNVTDDMRAIVYDMEEADIRYAAVRLGLVVFDNNWQQVGPVRWLQRGRIDMIETSNEPDEKGNRIKAIELSVGSYFTGRKFPGQGTFTNASQQSYPGSDDDKFCERTPLMTNAQKPWGNFHGGGG